jgi:hypothetical protein
VIKRKKLLVILALVGISLAAPVLFFFARPPVLIVTDAPFAALHGVSQLRRQQVSASLALFRQVKPVKVADGVSPDLVSLSITEVSRQPFCVLFPRSHSSAAVHFHERFPEVNAVVLSGSFPVSDLPPLDGFFCEYVTDRETDYYRAGLFAGILGGPKQAEKQEEPGINMPARTYILRQDRLEQAAERELFSQGVKEQDPEAFVFFAHSAEQAPDLKGIDVLVLSGEGGDFLEKNPKIPVILFTWLDPALTSGEVVVQFDDSAWALAVPAVQMALKGEAEGKIPSKPLIFSRRITDKNKLRLLEKSTKKMP